MPKLLLLSNSTMPGTAFFTWPRPYVQPFLGSNAGTGVFIPFAAVTFSFAEYEKITAQAFSELGYILKSIHTFSDPKLAIKEASVIVAGGGNSFALLTRMYEADLLQLVREKVLAGTPYIGWSAGANLACPTIMTTNDMPIVQPPSFNALNLIPFQLNPHYHELKFEGQGGETRKQRLEEFMIMNPEKKIIGLPEGMLLHRNGSQLTLLGNGEAKLYSAGRSLQTLPSQTEISYLLK